MASAVSAVSTAVVAPRATVAQAPRGLRPLAARPMAARPSAPRKSTTVQAVPVEVAQVANEAAFIGGTAAVMFGITLVGLAFGFILLRVESLVEDGQIDI